MVDESKPIKSKLDVVYTRGYGVCGGMGAEDDNFLLLKVKILWLSKVVYAQKHGKNIETSIENGQNKIVKM